MDRSFSPLGRAIHWRISKSHLLLLRHSSDLDGDADRSRFADVTVLPSFLGVRLDGEHGHHPDDEHRRAFRHSRNCDRLAMGRRGGEPDVALERECGGMASEVGARIPRRRSARMGRLRIWSGASDLCFFPEKSPLSVGRGTSCAGPVRDFVVRQISATGRGGQARIDGH